MNRTIRLLSLLFAVTVSAPLNYHVLASEATSKSTLKKHIEQLLEEDVKLSPVGAFGDIPYYVVEIDKEHMCGISHGRLKIFKKSNIEDVTTSYWGTSRHNWKSGREPCIFKFYKGYVYLPQADGNIDILDVRNPDEIRFIKKLDIMRRSFDIDIGNDRLFAYDNSKNELVVWSLSDPESPTEITRFAFESVKYKKDNRSGSYPIVVTRIVVSGDRIYMTGNLQLIVMRLKEDNSLELSGQTTIESKFESGWTSANTAKGLVVAEPVVYLFCVKQIQIFDVSEPDNITLKSTVESSSPHQVVMQQGHMFAIRRGGLNVYDISEPLNPKIVRQYSPMPGDFLIGDSRLYDVSGGGAVSPLAGLPTPGGKETRFGIVAENVLAHDNMLFVFGRSQLRILDLRVPWNPEQIGYCKARGYASCNLLIHKNHLFTTGEIFDISNPRRPVLVCRWNGGRTMDKLGDFLFMSKGDSLEIWDISSPAKVSMIRKYKMEHFLVDVAIHKGVIYLGFANGFVRACRLKSNYELETIGEISPQQTGRSSVSELAVEDDLLYVVLDSDGIVVVDIIDPENLDVYSRFNLNRLAERIKVVDGYAFVALGSYGTAVVDMAEKGFEKKVAHYPSTHLTKAIDIAGSFVYTAEYSNGVMVYVSSVSGNAQ